MMKPFEILFDQQVKLRMLSCDVDGMTVGVWLFDSRALEAQDQTDLQGLLQTATGVKNAIHRQASGLSLDPEQEFVIRVADAYVKDIRRALERAEARERIS